MNDEQERLKRLRDRQLADRNPKVKQQQILNTYHRKERKARSKRYTLSEAWQTIPHIYRTPLLGLVIGVGVIFLLPFVWNSAWAFWVGVIATIVFILIGIAIGQALDLRDRLKDFGEH